MQPAPAFSSVRAGSIPWYREIRPDQWRVLVAAKLGWMLDAMDFMLYAMAIGQLRTYFGFNDATAGMLGTITLVMSGIGGVLFGYVADRVGRARALMTTIHAMTNDQSILDVAHKDLRRARTTANNIIPTSTGAAKAVGLVLPDLKGKFNGMAFRVPTVTVSVVDLTAELERPATKEEINAAFKAAADGALKGILEYVTAPLVSIDFRGNAHSAMLDAAYTKVLDGDFVKVMAWYDNEWGYSSRCVDLLRYMASKGL